MKPGRKKGITISTTEFDDLVTALGKNRREIAELLGGTISQQAVSSWRYEKSIPVAYLVKIGSALIAQLKTREHTLIDKRALEFLHKAKITLIEKASGPGVRSPHSAINLKTEAPVELLSNLDVLKNLSGSMSLARSKGSSHFDSFTDRELINALLSRGYVVGKKLNFEETLEELV